VRPQNQALQEGLIGRPALRSIAARRSTVRASAAKFSLAFSLSTTLAFRSLFLRVPARQALPREATANNLRAHKTEVLRSRNRSPVVAERLFAEISKQMERLHPCNWRLNHTPEDFHCIGVYVSHARTPSLVNNSVLVFRRKTVVGLQRVAEQRSTSLDIRRPVDEKCHTRT